MINQYIEKAKILCEALPYIQAFSDKIVVIKYGGSAMEDVKLQESVAQDIVLLKTVGLHPVLVHGGGKAITHWLDKSGISSEFINGQRKTSPEAMEVIEMVLTGKVNKSIVNMINKAGGKAVGLSGKDADLIQAAPIDMATLGLAGKIKRINPDIVQQLIKSGHIPVISTIGTDKTGASYNINADFAAAEIAIALNAEKLIILSNVEGLMDDQQQIIKQINKKEIDELIDKKTISSGMIPKASAAIDAVTQGVHNVHIISGVISHSILLELFTDYGIGTMVKP